MSRSATGSKRGFNQTVNADSGHLRQFGCAGIGMGV